ncbi:MAG: putative outer rane adhesin like protein, partial [Pedosphaera sp.]|nr:putative outer rane adhesin like protein [Pedosphaera sp.]
MGENDPSAFPNGVASTLQDSVGANYLTTVGGPFYDTNVSSEASARVGSTFAVNFFSGGANASGALLTNVTDNFGLEGWFKPTSTSGNHCLMYSGNTGNSGWGVMQVGNTFQGLFGGVTFFGSGAVSLNTWTHVALVRNAGTATLYVNGVSAGTTTSTPNASSGKFAIGSSPPTLIADFI